MTPKKEETVKTEANVGAKTNAMKLAEIEEKVAVKEEVKATVGRDAACFGKWQVKWDGMLAGLGEISMFLLGLLDWSWTDFAGP